MSLLPCGTISPARIQYAIVGTGQDSVDDVTSASLLENSFNIGDLGNPLPAGALAADLLVIPPCVHTDKDLATHLGRLTDLGSPNAALILAASSNSKHLASVLEGKGFETVFDLHDSVALFKRCLPEQANRDFHGVTNGTLVERGLVIIEPPDSTGTTRSFCGDLQANLSDRGYTVSVTTLTKISTSAASELGGSIYISLLELNEPILSTLSEPVFHSFRKLVLNSKRLLWITAGDDPAMGVVDGIRRTVRNEVAGIKFQVLHLSNLETALCCGPRLACRIITGNTKDDEFRERNGMLEVARIFNSVEGNECIRHCLEDSVRVQSLKHHEDALRLTILKPGLLDTLTFIADDRMKVPLAETEIEVEIKATGVR
jgi:zearalenone synthase (highly reducing iterative type I polyketide synthase)